MGIVRPVLRPVVSAVLDTVVGPTNPDDRTSGLPWIPAGNTWEIILPLVHDRYDDSGQGRHATLSRNTEATVVDHKGNVLLTQLDEFRFTGARRVENLAIDGPVTQVVTVIPGEKYTISAKGPVGSSVTISDALYGHIASDGVYRRTTADIAASAQFVASVSSPTTGEIIPVAIGDGNLLAEHTDTAYYPDHEGLYHAYAVNEPVWKWGRVVENLALWSEDLSVSGGIWTRTSGITFDSHGRILADSVAEWIYQTISVVEGETYTFRFENDDIPDNSDVSIYNETALGWIQPPINPPTRNGICALSIVIPAGCEVIRIYPFRTNALSELNTPYAVSKIQCEKGALPSEYQKTEGATVREIYATANGNTVTDNIVTEALGEPLSPAPMLVKQGAAENINPYSRDYSGYLVTGTLAAVADQVGIDGTPDTAWTVSDNDTVSHSTLNATITTSGVVNVVYKAWYKKDQDETRFPVFQMNFTGGTQQAELVQLNTKTGASVSVLSIGSELRSHEVISVGDYWVCMLQMKMHSGTTAVKIYVKPASGDVWGVEDNTITGSVVVGQMEAHHDKTIDDVRNLGPIFTEGTAVSVGAITNTYDDTNHSDSEGPYQVTFDYTGNEAEVLKVGDDAFLDIIPNEDIEINLPLLTDRYDISGNGRHATLARADATDCATVLDFEGNTKRIPANVFPFKGSRVVENLNTTFTTNEIGGGSCVDNGDDTYTCSTSASGQRAFVAESIEVAVGDIFRITATFENVSYDTLWTQINLASTGAAAVTESRYIAEDNRVTALVVASSTGTAVVRVGIGGIASDTAIGSMTVTKIQFENVTGSSNQAPSEFVEPNDSCCSVEDVAIRCFNKHNSLYVDGDGVVHEGYGKDIYSWNRSTDSNNYDVWGKTNGATNDGNAITFPAHGAASIWDAAVGNVSANNSQGVELKGAVGGEKVRLRLWDSVSGSHYSADIVLTTDYVRYFQDGVSLGNANMNFGVYQADGNAKTFYMQNHQYEHQPQSTTYIPTFGSIEIRYGPTLEGSTKQLIDPAILVGFVPEEEHKNLVDNSNDLIASYNAASSNNVQVDDYRTLNITTNSNNAYAAFAGVAVTLGDVVTGLVRILPNGSATGIIGFRIASNDATPISIDLSTITVPTYFTITGTMTANNAATVVIEGRSGFGGDGSVTGTILIESSDIIEKAYPLSHVYTNGAAATREADTSTSSWPTGLLNDFKISCDAILGVNSNSSVFSVDTGLFTLRRKAQETRLQLFAPTAVNGTVSSIDTTGETQYALEVAVSSTDSKNVSIDGVLDPALTGVLSTTDLAAIASLRLGNHLDTVWLNGPISNVKVIRINEGNLLRLTDGTNEVTTPIIRNEQVVNGTFDTTINDWIDTQNHWEWVAGEAYHSASGSFNTLKQAIPDFAGRTVELKFDYRITAGGNAKAQWRDSSDQPSDVILQFTENGSFSERVTVPADGYYISFARTVADQATEFYIDNVSIKEIDPLGNYTAAVAFDATANQMALKLENTWTPDVPYNGSFGSGRLGVGIDSRRLLRLYETGLEAQKYLLDTEISYDGIAASNRLILTVNGTLNHLQVEVGDEVSEEVIANDSCCSVRDIAVRCYPYTNGVTFAANGVVTEARGADIDPAIMKRLLVEEEGTNLNEYSDDLAAWIKNDCTVNGDEITFSGVYNQRIRSINGGVPLDTPATVSFKARLVSGSLPNLACSGLTVTTGGGIDEVPVSITSDWQDFSLSGYGNGVNECGFIIRGTDVGVLEVEWHQWENKTYSTSLIPTSGASATRLADNCQTVWPAGLVNDFVVNCEAYTTDKNASATVYALNSTSNRIRAQRSISTQTLEITKRVASINYPVNMASVWIDDGLNKNIKERLSTTVGVDGWHDNIKGTNNPNTLPLVTAPDAFHIGQDWNNVLQLNGNIGDINVINGDLTDEEIYYIDNPDPWEGMTLDFQALTEGPYVDVGEGNLTTVRASEAYMWNPITKVYDLYAANEPLWNTYGELQYYPAATNLVTVSNDANGVGWSTVGGATIQNNLTDLYGNPNGAQTIYDVNNASAAGIRTATIAGLGNDLITGKIWVPIDSDNTRRASLRIGVYDAGWVELATFAVSIKTDVGILQNVSGGGFTPDFEIHAEGNWWVVTLSATVVGADKVIPYFHPAAYGYDDNIWTIELIGSCGFGQMEIHSGKTIAEVRDLPPIPTEGAAVTMNATNYSFDIANHDNDDGIWVCDWRPSYEDEDITQNTILATSVSNRHILTHNLSSLLLTYDGTNQLTLKISDPTLEKDKINTIANVYHAADAVMSLHLRGHSIIGDYDGAFVSGVDIKVFVSNPTGGDVLAPATMRNLRRYHITSHIQGKTYVSKGFPYIPYSAVLAFSSFLTSDLGQQLTDGINNLVV